jgi:hypothetical protein
MLPSFHKLFNLVFSNSHYPKQWGDGYITAVHKSGSISDPSNFRGITFMNAVGKLYNTILNNRTIEFLAVNKIITPVQVGFTKKASTTDQVCFKNIDSKVL